MALNHPAAPRRRGQCCLFIRPHDTNESSVPTVHRVHVRPAPPQLAKHPITLRIARSVPDFEPRKPSAIQTTLSFPHVDATRLFYPSRVSLTDSILRA